MINPLGTGLGVYIPLYFYVGMILAALLSIAWKPRLGLYFLILLIPLATTRVKLIAFPLGAQVIDILWFSVFVGLVFRRNGNLIPKARINGFLVAFAIFTFISLWQGWLYLGGDPPIYISDPRFSDWKNYMVMPIIAVVVAAALRDKKQIKFALLLIVLAACLVNWSFFRSTSGRDFSHFSYEIRDAGVIGYAGVNGLAVFAAGIIVFLATLSSFLRTKIMRLALAAVIAFSVYSLLFAFSRGGYLACLTGISFMALFRQKKLLVGVVVLLIAWQAILPAAVQERINMTYDKNDQELDPSAGDRVSLWKDAANLIVQNPITGSGFDTYQYMRRVGRYTDTHNYYIKVLVEMGLIGLLLLLAILFQMWRLGFQLFKTADDPFLQGLGLGFAALVICIAVANLFGDRWTYLPEDGYLWVLLGCVMRAHQIAKEEGAEKATEVAGLIPSQRDDLVTVS